MYSKRESNPLIAIEILTLRHGLWTHVASRKHTPTHVFFGGEDELMLYGGVSYRLKADPEKDVYVPWAGRVVFAPQEGGEGVKMQFYQVYLVGFHLVGTNEGFGMVLIDIGSVGAVGEEMRLLLPSIDWRYTSIT